MANGTQIEFAATETFSSSPTTVNPLAVNGSMGLIAPPPTQYTHTLTTQPFVLTARPSRRVQSRLAPLLPWTRMLRAAEPCPCQTCWHLRRQRRALKQAHIGTGFDCPNGSSTTERIWRDIPTWITDFRSSACLERRIRTIHTIPLRNSSSRYFVPRQTIPSFHSVSTIDRSNV